MYKNAIVGDYLADTVIDDKIILEPEAVIKLYAQHLAQTHSHLVATGYGPGIVLKFGVSSLQYRRVIN